MAELEETIKLTAEQVWDRTVELVLAPINNMNMLWIAIPLVIATIFMTLYFGRYKKEELGWNTAFGNTMVFVFVAVAIIREMYIQGGETFDAIFAGGLYSALAAGLIGAGLLLMFFTYFHLLPKKLAFFLFSAPPINVSVYAVMSLVYASVAADYITALAAVVLLIIILIITKILQLFIGLIGLEAHIDNLEIPGIVKAIGKEVETDLDGIEKEIKKKS
ncbi:hypothetical protein KKE92_02030 [Candidatus Micrarchaeota archaeon]|nr:hypothetical protein [Candidatus Micrarchaeota archaeon]